jgi:hypothetical protein
MIFRETTAYERLTCKVVLSKGLGWQSRVVVKKS